MFLTTVPAPIIDAACNQKLFHSHRPRLIIKRGLKSNVFIDKCNMFVHDPLFMNSRKVLKFLIFILVIWACHSPESSLIISLIPKSNSL